MPNSEALKHIRDALTSLTKARDSLGEALSHTREKTRECEHLQDLHKRVSQSIALLPHGGER